MVKLEIVRKNAPMLFQKVAGSRTWWIRCPDAKGRLFEGRVGDRKSAEEKLRLMQVVDTIKKIVRDAEKEQPSRRRKRPRRITWSRVK